MCTCVCVSVCVSNYSVCCVVGDILSVFSCVLLSVFSILGAKSCDVVGEDHIASTATYCC